MHRRELFSMLPVVACVFIHAVSSSALCTCSNVQNHELQWFRISSSPRKDSWSFSGQDRRGKDVGWTGYREVMESDLEHKTTTAKLLQKEEKGIGRRNLPGLSSLKWPPGLQHLHMQQAALRSYVIIFSIMWNLPKSSSDFDTLMRGGTAAPKVLLLPVETGCPTLWYISVGSTLWLVVRIWNCILHWFVLAIN